MAAPAVADVTDGTIKVLESTDREFEGLCVPACWGTNNDGDDVIAFKDEDGEPFLVLTDGASPSTQVEILGPDLMAVSVAGISAVLKLIPN